MYIYMKFETIKNLDLRYEHVCYKNHYRFQVGYFLPQKINFVSLLWELEEPDSAGSRGVAAVLFLDVVELFEKLFSFLFARSRHFGIHLRHSCDFLFDFDGFADRFENWKDFNFEVIIFVETSHQKDLFNNTTHLWRRVSLEEINKILPED